MPHAFVTGATGFVGSEVALQLLDAGWEVTATRRSSSKLGVLADRKVRWVEVDLHDSAGVARVMPERIDGVFHCAGNTTFWRKQHEQQVRDNVVATQAMLHAARLRKARRFVFTSSAAAYGRHSEPLREDLPSRALLSPSLYDRTKWQAECDVRRAAAEGLEAVILNPGGVIGPRDPNFTPMLRQAALGKLPAAMPADTSLCHVGAVAKAHLAAYERGRVCENYLLGGPNTSQLALAQAVARAARAKEPRRTVPPWLMRRIGGAVERVCEWSGREPPMTRGLVDTMCHRWFMDSSKAIAELDYAPPSLERMAEELVTWMREQGMLPAAPAEPTLPPVCGVHPQTPTANA